MRKNAKKSINYGILEKKDFFNAQLNLRIKIKKNERFKRIRR